MKSLSVRWKAWHGDEACILSFPDAWEVQMYSMVSAPEASESDIRKALSHPVGCPPLEVIARGKRRVALAVDDLTRPTPTGRLLPIVLDNLQKAAIEREQIAIIVALGSHAPFSDAELAQKLGEGILRNYRVIQHNPSQDLCEIDMQLGNIPVRINRTFLEADFKITMGGITPHPFAGFSGGGKLVLPGLANIEIIERTHRYVVMGFRGGLGIVEGNQFREEVEQVCRKCGVDLIIDAVVNHTREVAGVFVGGIQEAYLKGVEFARQVYRTSVSPELDVAILNAYPKDTDLVQSENALNILRSVDCPFVKEQGQIVLMSASSHGVGTHGLFAPGGRLYHRPLRKRWLREKGLLVYAPGVNEEEARSLFWKGYPFCQTWEEVIKELQQFYPDQHCKVGVFPCGSIQLGEVV